MNQQRTSHRYRTLVRLGATYETLRKSARKQIVWYMGLPIVVAVVNSFFGIEALASGLISPEVLSYKDSILMLCAISAIVILILCVVELIYMTIVKRYSDKYLLTLLQPQREE